ncbi:hypothetical protein [Devosia sp. RR2S18]|uniref:hypothetical protein n=1 Tax=Devosia rhizosphaerae TaxID=3049774 RepID=UPI0025416C0A|nr:hypothetical protein [Devosia sp. RR2S18]WIJ24574.1 hypothetical protein QOV41_16375 [Devosia sp. RR2S18]
MNIRTGLALSLLAASSLAVSAEPFHHPFGEWREYNRDWLAACPDEIDEDGASYYEFSCFASAGSQELNSAGLPAYKLSVIRNRLTGTLDVTITVAADGVEVDESRPLALEFSGEPAVELLVGEALETRHNTINQYFLADPAQLESVLAKMKERTSVTMGIPVKGERKVRQVWISLQGVLASLDFMEAYARRVAQY